MFEAVSVDFWLVDLANILSRVSICLYCEVESFKVAPEVHHVKPSSGWSHKAMFRLTEDADELERSLQRLLDQLEKLGCLIKAVFLDNCCTWGGIFQRIFERIKEGEKVDIFLDRLHLLMRYTAATKREHPLWEAFQRDLSAAITYTVPVSNDCRYPVTQKTKVNRVQVPYTISEMKKRVHNVIEKFSQTDLFYSADMVEIHRKETRHYDSGCLSFGDKDRSDNVYRKKGGADGFVVAQGTPFLECCNRWFHERFLRVPVGPQTIVLRYKTAQNAVFPERNFPVWSGSFVDPIPAIMPSICEGSLDLSSDGIIPTVVSTLGTYNRFSMKRPLAEITPEDIQAAVTSAVTETDISVADNTQDSNSILEGGSNFIIQNSRLTSQTGYLCLLERKQDFLILPKDHVVVVVLSQLADTSNHLAMMGFGVKMPYAFLSFLKTELCTTPRMEYYPLNLKNNFDQMTNLVFAILTGRTDAYRVIPQLEKECSSLLADAFSEAKLRLKK
ncbi:hypothetical protein BDR26DRAFT_946782 [Obelidium mucronatum]|nr:hypothetical protein BDR26DRAFT_946782 [Obelidium mucronatum]